MVFLEIKDMGIGFIRHTKFFIITLATCFVFTRLLLASPDSSVIQVIESNDLQFIFEVKPFEIDFEEKIVNGVRYFIPKIEGYERFTEPGKPSLPIKGILLGIPAMAELSCHILEVQTSQIDQKNIYPYPKLVPSLEGQDSYLSEQFFVDENIYSQNSFFPQEFVKITDIANIRHQRVARIEVHPIQYNPVTHQLIKIERLKVAVTFKERPSFRESIFTSETFQKNDLYVSVYNKLIANYEQAQKWQQLGKSLSVEIESVGSTYSNNSNYKLYIPESGVYRLDFKFLQEIVVDIYSLDPRTIKVYNKGQEIPLLVMGEADGRFDEEDYIEFYGQKNLTNESQSDPYTDVNVYWLTWGQGQGLRFKNKKSLVTRNFIINDHIQRVHIEKDSLYYHGDNDAQVHNTEQVEGEGWVWRFFYPGENEIIHLNVNNIAVSEAPHKLKIKLRGTTIDPVRPNHHIKIFLNDSLIGNFYLDRTETYLFETSAVTFFEGTNKLEILSVGDTGAKIDQVYLDWIELEYPRQLIAENGYSEFSVTSQNEVAEMSIWGFDEKNIHLYDLSNKVVIDSTTIKQGERFIFRIASAGFNDGNFARIEVNSKMVITEGYRGHNIAVIDEVSGQVLDTKHFDTYNSSADANNMASYIQNLPNRRIVLAAIRDEGSVGMTENAHKALESLGSSLTRNVGARDSWALIGKKGASIGTAIEALTPSGSGIAAVQDTLILEGTGGRFYLTFSDSVNHTKKYVVVSETGLKRPLTAKLDTVANLSSTDNGADLIIITHKKFINSAKRLAQFRTSQNHLRTMVVDVEDIFDEFNYGILNPQSIKEFLKFAFFNWQQPGPVYVIFFGDASWDFKKNLGENFKENYVPSYGNPVSDNWYVCFDGPDDFLPEMFVGRIPVETVEQAEVVIDKIVVYENSPSESWKKNTLFITGGFNRSEQNLFMNQTTFLINNYVSPPPASCRSVQINKSTEGYIEGEKKEEIIQAMNKGAMWVNFLGHAGSQTWDLMFNHPDIEELENENKYPFITSMTCHTGRFANPEISSFGENFLNADRKGAIAFWGTTGWGYVFQDNILLKNLFKSALTDTLHSLGEATTLSKIKLWEGYGSSIFNISTIHQYTLLGDPLINLALPEKPDITIRPQDVGFSPAAPAEADSILSIKITVQNWGLATKDSVKINIYNIQSNGIIPISKSNSIPPLGLQDSLTVFWSLKDQAGEHHIRIVLDKENEIDEVDEENNSYDYPLYVYSSKITISKPFDFQVLPPQDVVLQVNNPSGSSAENVSRFYQFEVDTTEGYNIPEKIVSPQIPEGKIVTKWRVTQLKDNMTYFWRCRAIEGSEVGNWVGSSFATQQVNQNIIWQQAHHNQFNKNVFNRTQMSNHDVQIEARKFIFYVESAGFEDGNYAQILINSIPVIEQKRGHNVVVVLPNTGEVLAHQGFDTWESRDEANAMADFIANVTDGCYVLAAIRDEGSYSMTEAAYQALESIGSQSCRDVGSRDSWAIVGIKGAPIGSVKEKHVLSTQGTAVVKDTLINYFNEGTITSPPIGPASSWNHLSWIQNIDAPGTNITLDVFGFNKKLTQWDTLLTGLTHKEREDLSSVNAQIHSLIKLRAVLIDDGGLNTPYLSEWSVFYEPVPDLAIGPSIISFNLDTLMEGEILNIKGNVYNVGMKIADSVKIRFTINAPDSGKIKLCDDRILENIGVDTYQNFEQTWSPIGRVGLNLVFIEIDPEDEINELTEANNFFSKPIYVLTDTVKPEIIVTFNGKQIVDGDYVSSQPHVLISIYDETEFSVLNDTTRVNIFFDNNRVPYSGHDNYLKILPVDNSKNPKLKAQLSYTPELSEGEHKLEVFAKDARNNLAYQSNEFQVISEFTILNVFNFPNPFHDNTEFTFHLTQPTERLAIKIYTVAGRLIRTLEQYHLEAGFHRIFWNGLDQDRNEIANGVYLYKIIAKSGEKQVERIEKLAVMR